MLRQQQLSVALQLMVVVRAVEVGRDVHTLHPQLTINNHAISIYQRGLTQTETLNLRTRQHDACREFLDEEILKRGLAVLYLYRTLLTKFLLLLIHCPKFNLLFLIFNLSEAFNVFVTP